MAVKYNDLYMDLRARLRKAGVEDATQAARELVCTASGKTKNELLRDGAQLALSGWDVLREYEGLYPHTIRRKTGKPLDILGENMPVSPAGKADPAQKDIDNGKDLEYSDLEEQLAALSPRQLKIVSAIDGECYADSIIEKTKLTAAEVMSELTMLQIMGYVAPAGFDKYRLNIKTKRG